MGYAQVVNQASFLHRDLDLIPLEHVVVFMRTIVVLLCNILWLTEPKQFILGNEPQCTTPGANP